MRYFIVLIAVLGMSAPAVAGHVGSPPGQAAKAGADRNADGRTNGKDYAAGQSAAEETAEDLNDDGRINGADYSYGQNK